MFQPIALNASAPDPNLAGVLKEVRMYDAVGRSLEQTEYYGANETRNGIAIAGWVQTERHAYNANGQVVQQLTRGRVLGWVASGTVSTQAADSALTDLSSVTTIRR